MNPLPKRLRKEPLIEVLWQLQFQGNQGVGDLLSGILFSQLKKSIPKSSGDASLRQTSRHPLRKATPTCGSHPKC